MEIDMRPLPKPTPKDVAADQLTALLLGLVNDESFELQCEAMKHLLRALPQAGLCPSFMRWTNAHRQRLITGNQTKEKVQRQQMLLDL